GRGRVLGTARRDAPRELAGRVGAAAAVRGVAEPALTEMGAVGARRAERQIAVGRQLTAPQVALGAQRAETGLLLVAVVALAALGSGGAVRLAAATPHEPRGRGGDQRRAADAQRGAQRLQAADAAGELVEAAGRVARLDVTPAPGAGAAVRRGWG